MLHPWLVPYYQQFISAVRQGRQTSSVIIAGAEGLGGNELALAMAQYYLCHEPGAEGACGHCRSCTSFKRLVNQDLKVAYTSTTDEFNQDLDFTSDCSGLITRPEAPANRRRSMRIDTMRKITDFLNESATGGGRGKVVIVSGAEAMSEGAANAVLKTFEEPQPNTLILMVARSLESLLPTILSRAAKVVLRDVSTEQALAYLLNPENQKPRLIRRLDAEAAEDFEQQEQEALQNCPGLEQQVTRQRAEIALCLNSYAPLAAMDMMLKGYDLAALEVVQSLTESIKRHDAYRTGVIGALNKLPKNMQARLLSELILEVLKYKAWVSEEQLPLIRYADASVLMRLQTDHLFEAMEQLKFIGERGNMGPVLAPAAVLRAWLQAFASDMGA